MKNFLLLILFSFSIHLSAQENYDGLTFTATKFIFPKTENWISSIDSISVTNTTTKKIFLLTQKYPREFEVKIPTEEIDPGQTKIIEIIYKPSEKGKFNSSIQIYQSASQTPVIISYKGEVLSFDEFADIACPSFSKPNLKPADFDLEILTLDSVTQKPLANSFIEITKGEFYSQYKTDENGMLKKKSEIGYYIVLAEHPGYKSKTTEKHINPKNHKIILAMLPVQEQKIIVPEKIFVPPQVVSKEVGIKKDSSPALPNTETNFSLTDYKKNNIIFLIDKSSSMGKPDCIPFLQSAMTTLAKMTRAEDNVTIITYANEAKVVLEKIKGSEHGKMIAVIQQLKCGGKTEGGKAIHTAYKIARENFINGGINQIIIATDGGFNGLSEDEVELMQLVGVNAKKEIKLSVLSFGQNRFGKAKIERLAKQGEGFYLFISNENEANEKLIETIKLQSKIK